jgi:hypothetical protein
MFAKHNDRHEECPKTKSIFVPVENVADPAIVPQAKVVGQTETEVISPYILNAFINKNAKTSASNLIYENKQPTVLEQVFDMYHHPSHPSTSEILLRKAYQFPDNPKSDSPYAKCDRVYLTRTGSLANMPNKCMIMAFLPDQVADPIPHYHRRGKISGLENMYQKDYIDGNALHTERLLLPAFLKGFDELVQEFKRLAGSDRKEIVIMVLNEGVLDVFLNFICSLKSSEPSQYHIIELLIVFAGQASLVPVLQRLGVKALYHAGLGDIPAKAAEFYGDNAFALLMWLKTTSVLIGTAAGYHVLFQDVDLVWLADPLPIIHEAIEEYRQIQVGKRTNRDSSSSDTNGESHNKSGDQKLREGGEGIDESFDLPDVLFMDDGAR